MSVHAIILEGKIEETLPDADTLVGRLGDGTLIYFKSVSPHRVYAKWKGKEVDVDLPRKECFAFYVSEEAVFFLSYGKMFKAVFTPPSYFAVTFLRFRNKCGLSGVFVRAEEDKKYAYRIFDDPYLQDKESHLVKYSDKDLEGLQLTAVHRGKAIFIKCDDASNEKNLSILIHKANVIALGMFPATKLTTYARDNSKIIMFAYGKNVVPFNSELMQFLPLLRIKNADYVHSIVSVRRGTITLTVGMRNDHNSYLMTASLPWSYCRETPPASKQPLLKKLTEREFNDAIYELQPRIKNIKESIEKECTWAEYPLEKTDERIAKVNSFKEPVSAIQSELRALSEICGASDPILYRQDKNSQNVLVKVRCDYTVPPLDKITAGEEHILLENNDSEKWKIQFLTGHKVIVPKYIFYPSSIAVGKVSHLQLQLDNVVTLLMSKNFIVQAHQTVEHLKYLRNLEGLKEEIRGFDAFHRNVFATLWLSVTLAIEELPKDAPVLKHVREEAETFLEFGLDLYSQDGTQLPVDVAEQFARMQKDLKRWDDEREAVNGRSNATVASLTTRLKSVQIKFINKKLQRNLNFASPADVPMLQDASDGDGNSYRSKFANEFAVTSIRGEGGFGCVFESSNKLDDWIYAVKRVAVDHDKMESALREVRAMAQLHHPGIVHYNGSWIEQPPEGWQRAADVAMLKAMGLPRNHLRASMNYRDDSVFIYIQMQLCNYSLSDWLKENQEVETRSLPRMKNWFKQLVYAVTYIHENNFIHRDLKPSNILFMEKDVLKVCDLGIATVRRNEDETESDITRSHLGTQLYMSPEQRLNKRYSSKTDVFSLGLIYNELLAVMSPEQRMQIFDWYRSGMQNNSITDRATADFVAMITQVDPALRPSCRQMLDHLYLA